MNKQLIIKLRKYISITLLVFIIGFFALLYFGHNVTTIQAHAAKVQNLLKIYINETGAFPESIEDLEKEKVLKVTSQDDKSLYLVRSSKFNPENPDEPSGWKKGRFKLDLFNISYGTKLENLEIDNDKLQDITSGQEILLINGPYGTKFPRHLKNTYQAISRSWFKEYEAFNLNKEMKN